MFSTKPILIFLAKFAAIYTVLVILISVLSFDKPYAATFRQINNTLFGKLGNGGVVVFEEYEEKIKQQKNNFDNKSKHDTKIIIVNKEKALREAKAAKARGESNVSKDYFQSLTINSWNIGGLPTLFVLALILATPILWKQKLWAVLWGFLLINVFILLKMWVLLVYEANQHQQLDIFNLGGFSQNMLNSINIIFSFLGFNLIVAILIWVLVSFRKDTWRKLVSL